MKIKKSRIREIIREELKSINEISGTGSAEQEEKTSKAKEADTALQNANSTLTKAQSDQAVTQAKLDASNKSKPTGKNSKGTTVDAVYQQAQKGGGYLYSDTAAKGYVSNPAYVSWNTANTAAIKNNDDALSVVGDAKGKQKNASDHWRAMERDAGGFSSDIDTHQGSDYTVSGGVSPTSKIGDDSEDKDDDEKNESLTSMARKILSKRG